MQRRLRPLVFLLLFSILMLYQNEYILYTNHFQNAFKGLQDSVPVINKAYSQSYGFFDGISNPNWELRRRRYQTQHRHADNDVRNQRNHIHSSTTKDTMELYEIHNAHLFYRDNYDAEFTCLNEMQLGVTHFHNHSYHQTPKWLCDPDRILSSSQERVRLGGNGCLAYIFDEGMRNPSQFWKDIYDELGTGCEIHVFSHDWNKERLDYLNEISDGNQGPLFVTHAWGIEAASHSHLGRKNYLTIQETLEELGHVGHTVDVLSLDCDGCEWSLYPDVLHSNLLFTQILVELHGAPYQVNDFFLEMKQHGYVAFHRETDMIDKGGGQNYAYSFIRLAPAFFEPLQVQNPEAIVHTKGLIEDKKKEERDHLSLSSKSRALPQDIRKMPKHQRIPRHSADFK